MYDVNLRTHLLCSRQWSEQNPPTSRETPGLSASRLQRGWHFHYPVLTDSPANMLGGTDCSSYGKTSCSAVILSKQLPVSCCTDTPGWNKFASLWAISAFATWMKRALPGDVPQKAAHQSPRCPPACQRALCNAGSDTGLHTSLYSDFILTVKRVKTHLSVTTWDKQHSISAGCPHTTCPV